MDETKEATLPSLREFVSAAILEIADGLNDAQDKGRNKGVKIAPESYGDRSTPTDIKFDLSVTSITRTNTGAGLSLVVSSIFGAKYENGGEGGITSSNRISFTLPVHFVVYNAPDSTRPINRPRVITKSPDDEDY